MRGSLSPLALVEARRLLTHPFLLTGAALSVVAIAVSVPREGQLQSFMLMGLAVLPLAFGTFLAANLAALRSRRDRAEELLDTLPRDGRTRTGAQLLAVLSALPLSVALLAAAYLLFDAGDGLVISVIGTRRVPAAVELLQGPLLVLTLGAVGVLLGRIAPVTPLALLLVVAIVVLEVPLAAWTPDTQWRWAMPLVNDIIAEPGGWTSCEPRMDRSCGIVERFDTTAMAWHLVALAVVTALASAIALAAGRRD
jgi:hypothetical protein